MVAMATIIKDRLVIFLYSPKKKHLLKLQCEPGRNPPKINENTTLWGKLNQKVYIIFFITVAMVTRIMVGSIGF